MTAALYALRANKSVLVIEKNGFGGQITYSPKVENSVLEGRRLCDREGTEAPCVCEEPAAEESKLILFTTATCPNCKIAKQLLDKAGIAYEALIAEEHADLVAKYGIRQAPTLVVAGADGFESYKGVSNIKGFLSAVKV